MSGIDSFHVKSRIGFRVAKLLCIRKGIFEALARLRHRGENIIGGAVDDAGDPAQVVGGQRAGQRRNDGNSTSYRCLKPQHRPFFPTKPQKFITIGRKNCLIGGDHILPALQQTPHQIQRHGFTADQLANHIQIVCLDDGIQILGEAGPVKVDFGTRCTAHNTCDDDVSTRPGANLFPVAG